MISAEVHNYVERILGQKIYEFGLHDKYSADQLADLCCLVLNQIPPRYIRHNVDLLYAMSESEQIELSRRVTETLFELEARVQSDRRQQERVN
ncbi:hypothetical protein VST7929_02813 [Vibrio stylophorae]|uniref:Competence protein ComFB n=1 Tax=Vibrio stylophorae TaxID=659351 RepID=A0ABN8DXY7_9VIBR|nr:late competence development ComFB family protein [Vibrio stylophorae]CAH0535152.1 hypothetical protein VST7929_02813 [Vibrio stylophorae]